MIHFVYKYAFKSLVYLSKLAWTCNVSLSERWAWHWVVMHALSGLCKLEFWDLRPQARWCQVFCDQSQRTINGEKAILTCDHKHLTGESWIELLHMTYCSKKLTSLACYSNIPSAVVYNTDLIKSHLAVDQLCDFQATVSEQQLDDRNVAVSAFTKLSWFHLAPLGVQLCSCTLTEVECLVVDAMSLIRDMDSLNNSDA